MLSLSNCVGTFVCCVVVHSTALILPCNMAKSMLNSPLQCCVHLGRLFQLMPSPCWCGARRQRGMQQPNSSKNPVLFCSLLTGSQVYRRGRNSSCCCWSRWFRNSCFLIHIVSDIASRKTHWSSWSSPGHSHSCLALPFPNSLLALAHCTLFHQSCVLTALSGQVGGTWCVVSGKLRVFTRP